MGFCPVALPVGSVREKPEKFMIVDLVKMNKGESLFRGRIAD
jgi:hypothetical protein